MGSTLFRNPWALSNALAALGSLRPQVLGFLNHIDPSDSASSYCIDPTRCPSYNTCMYMLVTNRFPVISGNDRACASS